MDQRLAELECATKTQKFVFCVSPSSASPTTEATRCEGPGSRHLDHNQSQKNAPARHSPLFMKHATCTSVRLSALSTLSKETQCKLSNPIQYESQPSVQSFIPKNRQGKSSPITGSFRTKEADAVKAKAKSYYIETDVSVYGCRLAVSYRGRPTRLLERKRTHAIHRNSSEHVPMQEESNASLT